MTKVYSVTIRNRVAATALAVSIVGLGVVFLTVGFVLLAALAAAGIVIGGGLAIYNRLRGREPVLLRSTAAHEPGHEQGLDPSLEIQPAAPPLIRPRRDSGGEPPAG